MLHHKNPWLGFAEHGPEPSPRLRGGHGPDQLLPPAHPTPPHPTPRQHRCSQHGSGTRADLCSSAETASQRSTALSSRAAAMQQRTGRASCPNGEFVSDTSTQGLLPSRRSHGSVPGTTDTSHVTSRESLGTQEPRVHFPAVK